MRLDCIERGDEPSEAQVLELIRTQRGAEPPDVLADSLGWEVPSEEAFSARAQAMLESGYALATVSDIVDH